MVRTKLQRDQRRPRFFFCTIPNKTTAIWYSLMPRTLILPSLPSIYRATDDTSHDDKRMRRPFVRNAPNIARQLPSDISTDVIQPMLRPRKQALLREMLKIPRRPGGTGLSGSSTRWDALEDAIREVCRVPATNQNDRRVDMEVMQRACVLLHGELVYIAEDWDGRGLSKFAPVFASLTPSDKIRQVLDELDNEFSRDFEFRSESTELDFQLPRVLQAYSIDLPLSKVRDKVITNCVTFRFSRYDRSFEFSDDWEIVPKGFIATHRPGGTNIWPYHMINKLCDLLHWLVPAMRVIAVQVETFHELTTEFPNLTESAKLPLNGSELANVEALRELTFLVPPSWQNWMRASEGDCPNELWLVRSGVQVFPRLNLPALRTLHIANEFIHHPPALTNVPALKHLSIRNCVLKEPPVLNEVPMLETLDLVLCEMITDPPVLTKLAKLEELDLSVCTSLLRPPDLTANALKYLEMHGCLQLRDPPVLTKLAKLERLTLSGCTSLLHLPDLTDANALKYFAINDCIQLRDPPKLPEERNVITRLSMWNTNIVLPDGYGAGYPNLKIFETTPSRRTLEI